jgi:pyruvate dehydrogenase E2 component (dihydrolipoamide acetyltransferase)
MAVPVIMPRQGQSVESCLISEWFVKKGDKVKEGDLLFSYETDKAAFEEEAKVSGTILEIFFDEGDDVPVLTNVCVIGKEGEDYSSFIPDGGSSLEKAGTLPEQQISSGQLEYEMSTSQPVQAEKAGQAIEPGTATVGSAKAEVLTGRVISPRARNLAENIGADLRFATPTGPGGRIIERDIRTLQQQGHIITPAAAEAYHDKEPLAGTGLGGRVTTDDISRPAVSQVPAEEKEVEIEYQDVKLSNIRKVIANTMHASLSQMAQLTLNASFDATNILKLRQQFKMHAEKFGLSNITLNDIILYAVSRILPLHKSLNAHFLGDTIRYFTNVHMGVAVDTERGLMVPTIFDANKKSLNQISIESKELAKECQKGTINPDRLKGGTFTVTNLGTLGIESFTPVINPPQTAILGVNTTEQKFRERDGVIEAYTSMSLSLTFDHRAVDGAPAARFLKDLKEALENFTLLLAK